jgi:hypothetical protein
VKISDRTRRLLLLATTALVVVGGGVAAASFVVDDGEPGLATVPASDGAVAEPARDDDYSLRDVTCSNNIFDEPLARGELVNIAESNKQFRVSVVFRDGDEEVGHGMKLLDELTPGESGEWAVFVEKEFQGDGLECDIRVDDAS